MAFHSREIRCRSQYCLLNTGCDLSPRNPLPCGRGSDTARRTLTEGRQSRDRKGAGSADRFAARPETRATSNQFTFSAWVERAAKVVPENPNRLLIALGLAAGFVGLRLIPWAPAPDPVVPDELSYLLQADTFASGRLTNPPHPHWRHFETLHVLNQPTYNSKYPPAQAVFLAAGQLLGHAWVGVLISNGLMLAALFWALCGAVSPRWALLGSVLAGLRFGVLDYWVNGYMGGCVAAIGGALALGAALRMTRAPRARDAVALAGGLVLLASSRPWEGLAAAIPVVGFVAIRWWSRQSRERTSILAIRLRAGLAFGAVLGAGACSMAVYNDAVTGSALRLPYVEYISQYQRYPYLFGQSVKEKPLIEQECLASYSGDRKKVIYERSGQAYTYFKDKYYNLREAVSFYCGGLLALFFLAAPWAIRRDRMALAPIVCLTVAGFAALERIPVSPQYVAPATAAIWILLTLCLRWVCAFRRRGFPVGAAAVGVAVVGSLGWFAVAAGEGVSGSNRELFQQQVPGMQRRLALESDLAETPGDDLVFVKCDPADTLNTVWVYNGANIDSQPVIWANDRGPESNHALTRRYPDRRFWIVTSSASAPQLRPLPPQGDASREASSATPIASTSSLI